ncbi:MAG TPA: OmpW family outer membrane protein [Vicinamibacterales bacterium]|nr:OmpW family outer membrane protein [Vicinamibacterales bacterium]
MVAAAILWSPPHAIAQTRDGAEPAHLAGHWFARVGVLEAIYHPSATIATSGQPIPGATATVSNNVTLMFDLGYDVTKACSVQMMGGLPPKPTVTGERTVASLGDLGAVRYGPLFVTGTCHLPRRRGWQVYVGAGAVYAIILDDHDRAVTDLVVLNNFGFALQGAIERSIGNSLELFVDFKQAWLAVDAHGKLTSDSTHLLEVPQRHIRTTRSKRRVDVRARRQAAPRPYVGITTRTTVPAPGALSNSKRPPS